MNGIANTEIAHRIKIAFAWRWPLLRRWLLSRLSLLFASLVGLPGCKLGWFGLWCAQRARGSAADAVAGEMSITPVNCTRYFEFDFALHALLPNTCGYCLDISSPRLLSAYVLARHPEARVEILNPDNTDLDETKKLMAALGIGQDRLGFSNVVAETLPWADGTFANVWCISVLEHIPVPDDKAVLCEMQRVLKPGGRLVLTFPAAAEAREEYRRGNPYGLSPKNQRADGISFFERVYDSEALSTRVVSVLNKCTVVSSAIWGEHKAGWFDDYVRQWQAKGADVTCGDAFNMAVRFGKYPSIEKLPGIGIIGLAFQKN